MTKKIVIQSCYGSLIISKSDLFYCRTAGAFFLGILMLLMQSCVDYLAHAFWCFVLTALWFCVILWQQEKTMLLHEITMPVLTPSIISILGSCSVKKTFHFELFSHTVHVHFSNVYIKRIRVKTTVFQLHPYAFGHGRTRLAK